MGSWLGGGKRSCGGRRSPCALLRRSLTPVMPGNTHRSSKVQYASSVLRFQAINKELASGEVHSHATSTGNPLPGLPKTKQGVAGEHVAFVVHGTGIALFCDLGARDSGTSSNCPLHIFLARVRIGIVGANGNKDSFRLNRCEVLRTLGGGNVCRPSVMRAYEYAGAMSHDHGRDRLHS